MMKGRAVLLLTMIAAALVVTSGAPLAQASPQGTLDANCQVGPAPGYTYIDYFGKAQTFTAIHSGKLTGAQVEILNDNSSSDDIVMEIRSADRSGVPTSSVLASTTIPASTIPTTAGLDTTTITGNFDLSSAASVVAAQQYALTLRTSSPSGIGYGLPIMGADPCPGGYLYYGSVSGGWGANPNYDIASFSTYVTSPPTNDNFADAQVINGSMASINGANTLATREAGDPSTFQESPTVTDRVNSSGYSVWYSWTAPASGSTTIDTCTTDYDSVLGVYTGSSLNSLAEVASDNNNCSNSWGSKVIFDAQAGTAYQIDVDGTHGLPYGTFTLKLGPTDTTPPTVDSANLVPRNGQTRVPRNTDVKATFLEEMDPKTLTDSNTHTSKTVQLFKGKSTTPVTAQVTVSSDGKTVTLDPWAKLARRTKYTAKITGGSSGAKDLAGNPLAQDYSWSFTTGRK